MELEEEAKTHKERERVGRLVAMIPRIGESVLEIGTRDGYIAKQLTGLFKVVVALDLKNPKVDHPAVTSVEGDVTSLQFSDNEFDSVVCSEVLEHLDPAQVQKACDEIVRVAKQHVIVGVPFEQDIRIGRTACSACGGINPPFGHRNEFSRTKLERLFSKLVTEKADLVGRERKMRTNWLSVKLMDLAGNPFGTYAQLEKCLYCNREIVPPLRERSLLKRVCSRSSLALMTLQNLPKKDQEKPIWIHLVFSKSDR